MIELIPNIKKMLKIFEPIILPTAISHRFLNAATAEVVYQTHAECENGTQAEIGKRVHG